MTEEIATTPDDSPAAQADEPRLAASVARDDESGASRATAVGRIAVALVVAWTAMVAVPGALPWATADDAARAIALGMVVASVIAIAGLELAWLRPDQLGLQGATVGTASALAALGLSALAVVNVLIVPPDTSYRSLVTGVGLLVLIAAGLAAVGSVPTRFLSGIRISSLTAVGTIIGIVVVVAYLLMLQTMVSQAPGADDTEWTRLTTLLSGLQTIAFAGLGALLGTAVQGQVTNSVRNDLGRADEALNLIATEARDIADEVRSRGARLERETEAILLDALRQDPARFRTDASLRRWIEVNRAETPDSLAALSDSLDQVIASARTLRAG